MSDSCKLLLIHALSPVHCGTGQSAGGIDLPIAREKPTGIPLIPGSTLKGVLRASPRKDEAFHKAVFGPDPKKDNPSEHAGSVQFSDALLLFLPVRSVRGTFAWVTSPYILRRFRRDTKEAGLDAKPLAQEPTDTKVLVTSDTLQVADLKGKVVLEDYDLEAKNDTELKHLAEKTAELIWGSQDESKADRDHFIARVCVVHDDVMMMLLQTCLEITARVQLDSEKKTVVKGALWTEEALPVETILAGLMVATPVKLPNPIREGGPDKCQPKELLDYVQDLAASRMVQLGGKATVGHGLSRMTVVG